jgi:FkbM family methyltransferase
MYPGSRIEVARLVCVAFCALSLGAVAFAFRPRTPAATLPLESTAPRALPAAFDCPSNWAEQASDYERKQKNAEVAETKVMRSVDGGAADGLVVWETAHGRFWTDADEQIARALPWELASIYNGLYGEGRESVQKGDVVLDCGAHFGAFTRYALDRGAALVVAIEIAPTSIASLQRTFAAEIGAKRVVVYPKGVSDRDATLTLRLSGHASAASTIALAGGRPGPQVQVTTIDGIVSELKLSRVDFIKMDVEGSEAAAIRGAAAVLSTSRPRMAISCYHNDNDYLKLSLAVRQIYPGYWLSMPRCWLRPWLEGARPVVDTIFFRATD